MKLFYKEIIKDLQKLPIEDIFLKSLDMSKSQTAKAHDSLWHCKVVASQMPSIQHQEVKQGMNRYDTKK